MANHLCQLLKTGTVLPPESSDSQPAVNAVDVQFQQSVTSALTLQFTAVAIGQQNNQRPKFKDTRDGIKLFGHKTPQGREIHVCKVLSMKGSNL